MTRNFIQFIAFLIVMRIAEPYLFNYQEKKEKLDTKSLIIDLVILAGFSFIFM